MLEGVTEFYIRKICDYGSDTTNPKKPAIIIQPVGRVFFSMGSIIALCHLVKNIFESSLSLLKCAATGFLNKSLRDAFFEKIRPFPSLLVAIPIGLLGTLFPQTVNERFLGIPRDGLRMLPENYLSLMI